MTNSRKEGKKIQFQEVLFFSPSSYLRIAPNSTANSSSYAIRIRVLPQPSIRSPLKGRLVFLVITRRFRSKTNESAAPGTGDVGIPRQNDRPQASRFLACEPSLAQSSWSSPGHPPSVALRRKYPNLDSFAVLFATVIDIAAYSLPVPTVRYVTDCFASTRCTSVSSSLANKSDQSSSTVIQTSTRIPTYIQLIHTFVTLP